MADLLTEILFTPAGARWIKEQRVLAARLPESIRLIC
jgi:hypothetical protein